MSNEQKDPQSEKKTDQINQWFVIGAGLGTTLGIVFHNLALGIGLGGGLGFVIGYLLSKKNKN